MQLVQKHTTAILVFANSSHEELKRKPIAQGHRLFDGLTEHTLHVVEKTNLPYFHFSEQEQWGTTFGERFAHAIQSIFDQGYETIITVGNDTPQLTTSHILNAHSHLQQRRFVLGPSQDGGFYLMGLHKSQFNRDQFQHFSWQTSYLIREVASFIRNNNSSIIHLEVLYDIDDTVDLKKLLCGCHRLSRKLLKAIVALLTVQINKVRYLHVFFDALLAEILKNKGSPILILT